MIKLIFNINGIIVLFEKTPRTQNICQNWDNCHRIESMAIIVGVFKTEKTVTKRNKSVSFCHCFYSFEYPHDDGHGYYSMTDISVLTKVLSFGRLFTQ